MIAIYICTRVYTHLNNDACSHDVSRIHMYKRACTCIQISICTHVCTPCIYDDYALLMHTCDSSLADECSCCLRVCIHVVVARCTLADKLFLFKCVGSVCSALLYLGLPNALACFALELLGLRCIVLRCVSCACSELVRFVISLSLLDLICFKCYRCELLCCV